MTPGKTCFRLEARTLASRTHAYRRKRACCPEAAGALEVPNAQTSAIGYRPQADRLAADQSPRTRFEPYTRLVPRSPLDPKSAWCLLGSDRGQLVRLHQRRLDLRQCQLSQFRSAMLAQASRLRSESPRGLSLRRSQWRVLDHGSATDPGRSRLPGWSRSGYRWACKSPSVSAGACCVCSAFSTRLIRKGATPKVCKPFRYASSIVSKKSTTFLSLMRTSLPSCPFNRLCFSVCLPSCQVANFAPKFGQRAMETRGVPCFHYN